MSNDTRRLWPAYLVTVLIAGAGHWYLGYWRRGFIWLGLYLLALTFLSARTISGAFEPGEPFILTALQFESIAYTDVAVPLAVLLVCLLDVYLLGLAEAVGSSSSATDERTNDD